MKTNDAVPTGKADSAPAQCQTNPPPRILVVDNDRDIRLLNAEVLKHSGYEVDAAEDGAAAWDALYANNYDLLISDHEMPKVSGVDLLKKLRAARMELPVIMATGTLSPQELERNPWLRPAATLLKPYTVEELVETVKEVLRATDSPREQTAPPPGWQSQPSADSWQL